MAEDESLVLGAAAAETSRASPVAHTASPEKEAESSVTAAVDDGGTLRTDQLAVGPILTDQPVLPRGELAKLVQVAKPSSRGLAIGRRRARVAELIGRAAKYTVCRPSSLYLMATRPAFRSHEGRAGFLYS